MKGGIIGLSPGKPYPMQVPEACDSFIPHIEQTATRASRLFTYRTITVTPSPPWERAGVRGVNRSQWLLATRPRRRSRVKDPFGLVGICRSVRFRKPYVAPHLRPKLLEAPHFFFALPQRCASEGFRLAAHRRAAVPTDAYLPLLGVTETKDSQTLENGLAAGAFDRGFYLTRRSVSHGYLLFSSARP